MLVDPPLTIEIGEKKIILDVNNKIIGYPGTGKTTMLISLLIKIWEKYPSLKITYISFTNEAVNTARERLLARSDGKNVKFGTIHSMAKKLIKSNSRLIHTDTRHCISCNTICAYHIFNFAKLYCSWYFDENIELDNQYGKYTIKIDGLWALNRTYTQPRFDMVLHYTLSSLIISNFGSDVYENGTILEKINSMISGISIPKYSLLTSIDEILDFTKEWISYKKENNLFEFDDLIFNALNTKIDSDILIVDEFQDLSTLQYELIYNWTEDVATVIIAGDYNQSIYGFQGGTPKYLIEFPVDNKIILNYTYRLSQKILDSAKEIIMDNDGFDTVISDRVDGDISRELLQNIDLTDMVMNNNSIFILARTNKQVDYLSDTLKNIFNNELSIGERAAYSRIINLYRNQQKDKILTILQQHAGRKELFLFAIENNLTLSDLENKMKVVRYMTIHASKGLEADLVILYDQCNNKLNREAGLEDEERRVWYVALTRSKGSVIIVHETTKMRTEYLKNI